MTGSTKPEIHTARQIIAWLIALFLVILGAKLLLIKVYGVPMPYGDQWNEANDLFKPWMAGHLTRGELFAPHNEHRIFFTRVLDLFEIWLNGQWDPIMQMVVSGMIHAGYACGLAYYLWALTGRKHLALICLLLIPFFALPFAAENTLQGFQSQMYFLSIVSLIAMVGLGLKKPGSIGWYGGLLAAVMALFTMGSGLLASLVVVGLMMARSLRERRITGSSLIVAGCGLAVFVVGMAMNVSSKQDEQYHTHSLVGFLYVTARNVAWPFRNQPLLLLVVCLPLVILFGRYLRSKVKNVTGAEFALMFGFWGFMQATALAYARTSLGNSSRYMDTLCTIPIAGMVSWLVMADDFDFRPWKRKAIPLGWGSLVLYGLFLQTGETLTGYLPWYQHWESLAVKNVGDFISTDNPMYLTNQPPLAVSYPRPDLLVGLLRDPGLQNILPPSCQRPLKIERDNVDDPVFIENGCPTNMAERAAERIWGSYSSQGAKATGAFISKPVSARLPRLVMRMCTGSSEKGIGVQLVEESSREPFDLKMEAIGRWQTLIVSAPKGQFRLVMTDKNPESWVAVGEIKQMGWLSPYVLKLLDFAFVILGAGIGLILYLVYLGQKVLEIKSPESGLRR